MQSFESSPPLAPPRIPPRRPPAPRVLLIEEDEIALAVTRRGAREGGERCQLTIAIDGAGAASFVEEAGAGAPRSAVVELGVPGGTGPAVLDALRTRPWVVPDAPVISFAPTGSAAVPAVDYLVKNAAMDGVIAAIREVLDLPPPGRPG